MFHESGKFDKISLVTLINSNYDTGQTCNSYAYWSQLKPPVQEEQNFLFKVVRTKANKLTKISFKLEHKINNIIFSRGSY
jgi:hypothetical protein